MIEVKKADWVMVEGSSVVGFVKHMAKDKSWADVDWGSHRKRMQTKVLQVQTTLKMGEWEVTDKTGEREVRNS